MSEAYYRMTGETVEETASAAVTAGDVAQKALLHAYAANDYAANDLAIYRIKDCIQVTLDGSGPAAKAGNPVWWDESADKHTLLPTDPISNAGDFFAGVLAEDVSASATTAYLLQNVESPDFPVFHGKIQESVAVDKTLDAEDSGKVINVTADAKTVTLPATDAGAEVVVRNMAADGTALISVSPHSSDKIMGPNVAGTDDRDQQNTKATAKRGDYLHLRGDGDAGWWIVAKRGTWVEASS